MPRRGGHLSAATKAKISASLKARHARRTGGTTALERAVHRRKTSKRRKNTKTLIRNARIARGANPRTGKAKRRRRR